MRKLILSAVALISLATTSFAQHRLQIDNGPGKLGIIDGSSLVVGTTVLNWPAVGGTILTQTGGAIVMNGITLNWPAANAAGVLTNDGAGNLSWGAGGGATSPAGANTQIQFNNAGAFGASANLTWNGSTMTVAGNSASAALSVGNATVGGVGLAITSGKLKGSIETIAMPPPPGGGNINIVGDAVVTVITDNASAAAPGSDKTIVFPGGTDGQILIILNNDTNQKAKTGGGALGPDLDTTAKEIGMFLYYSGTWHRVD